MEHPVDAIIETFKTINTIPRCSKNEARLAAWLMDWARDHGYEYQSDPAGNLVIRVPASRGMEDRPTVVLQGHMDMVCEKTPDSAHDFERDPIRVVRDGDWIHAVDTTLGADNGIALAMALVLAENDTCVHPPLELLFTVDEESGLIGAHKLDASLIRGRILINIDSEDEGVFTIGCAGGEETLVRLPVTYDELPAGFEGGRIVVGGLRGGHSGVDIHKPRANANRLLGRVLLQVGEREDIRLVSLAGGSAHNAIPRDASALLAFPAEKASTVEDLVKTCGAVFREETLDTEPALSIRCEAQAEALPGRMLSSASARKVIGMLNALPHGVHGMSTRVAGLVETSCNLAIIRIKNDAFEVISSQRSSSMSRLEEMTARVSAVARLAGASATRMNHHPAWAPDLTATLLKHCQEVYQDLNGKAPRVEIIHAGLECGLIGDKVPGMEMISIGPNLRHPHSPEERLEVPSVGRVYTFLSRLLASFGPG
ncbi:MAG: aminoacyl-histidine dipeptidase [Desulfobacterales bacterium]|jgi:dipeptidase D